MGDTVLSTVRKSGTAEVTEFNHPDRLGTRVVTNQASNIVSEQAHLPFGTALNAESTTSQSKRFTSYDRSAATGLDYAVNRTYDSKQGRFTQVDPIGMGGSSLIAPQTLNLYSYVGNDPINHTDPSGLFWGFFKKLFKAIFKVIKIAVAIFVTAVAVFAFTIPGGFAVGLQLSFLAAGLWADISGNKWAQRITAIASIAISTFRLKATATPNTFPFRVRGGGSRLLKLIRGTNVGSIINSFVQKKERRRQSIDGMALEWLRVYNRLSIGLNVEFNASICKNLTTGIITITAPNVGTNDSSENPDCPTGTTKVARVHTHAAYDPAYANEIFSDPDRINANNDSLDFGHTVYGYIGTPKGSFKKFIPASIRNSTRGKVIVLKK